jgi:hypothetical protein
MTSQARQTAVSIGLLFGCFSICFTATALAQLPPPPPPPATLWSFLGIPQGYRYVRDNAFNRSGNRPGMERKPPLKAIADPKNLESSDPSIKKAAEVKQAEDLKKQKIKAVKYLAKIGCGCYNRDGSITDALIKSLDDCTEEVRLATAQAIAEAAAGEQCLNCKMRSCCSEEISNKLYEVAYERDENGCFLEPSERVRMAAAEALRTCCSGNGDMVFMEPGPTPAPQTGGEQPTLAPEVGGERPSGAPPVLVDPSQPAPLQPRAVPVPVPVIPAIPNPAPPPAPINPPRAAMPKPAPVAIEVRPRPNHALESAPVNLPQAAISKPAPVTIISKPRSAAASESALTTSPRSTTPKAAPVVIDSNGTSRRTAMIKAQPAKSEKPAQSAVVVTHPLPPIDEPAYDAPASTAAAATVRVTPHWTPAAVQQTVFLRESVRGALPINEIVVNPSPENVVVASLPDRNQLVASEPAEIDETLGLAPIVSPDSVKRRSPKAQLIPSAPSTGGTQVVLPASLQKPSRSNAASSEPTYQPAPQVMTSDVSLDQPAKPARPKAVTSRQIPGAEFGAGTVTSVRLKDGLALIEFNTDASLPAGSLLRAYHQYALVSRKAVCDLQVIESENGKAVAVANGKSQISDLAVGDRALVLQ